MSSYLNNFIKETENDLNYVPPSLDTEEVTQPVTPVVQQEVVESVMQLNDEISTGKLIEGTAVSVTAEIGTGVGLTYALNRYRPAMKWLKGVSHASKLGIVAPEPSTTVAGIAGLAASEALIWAGSNLLGQSIRKAYGIQEEYSAGEALAAGVFGTTLVATKADKLIFGLARPAVDDVWKGREMLMTTAKGFKRKKFISGAALGLAESAMRQEIEVLMNDDKNRNEYDYLFSALAGGGANTLFGMWSRTGKWGREQAESVIRSSKENLKAQKIKAENQLKASQEPLPDAVTYGFGGGMAQSAKRSAEFDALKQLKHIEEAEEVMDDALNNVIAANKKLGEREANPQPLKDVVEEAEVTAPKAPEQTPDESKLSELSERVKNINSDNLTTEAPNIERDAKRLSERTTGKLRTAIATSIKDPDNVDNLQDALDAVVFQRKINKQVIDILETSGGRTLSAARRDSDKFNYEAKYSFRAAKEEASLSELEASLRQRLEGAESADIKKLFDDFINIRPNLKAQGKAINKKASKKGKGKAKPKAPLTDAQQAEKLKQTLAKKKANLQKELDTKRERFGDDVKLEEAQAKASKDKKPEDPEIKDLKERIKFYDDAEADVALIEKLEKQLARVVEIEASSIVGAQRAETSAKPKPPTKAPGKADELRQKITDTRARMRQRVADIDRAQAQINKERELSEIYRNYEKHFFESMEKDASTIFSKTLRSIQQARQLALIDQIPSVFAGLPTGVGAGIKQFFRYFGTLLDEGIRNRSGNAFKYANADAFGAMKMLTDTAGLMEAMKRTFREGASATTQTGSKFSDEVSQSSLPRGEHALISRAYDSAKRRADALDNVTNKFSGWLTTNNFWHILSLGVRGIQAVDEVFKRQVIKGRIWSQAVKNGMKAFPNDKAKAAAYAEQNYNAAWKDNDGLAVLDETNDFYDEVNQVNEELLFASNVDNVEDMYVPASEKIVKSLTELANDTDSTLLGNTLKLIMPFIGVPIRGAYRMANYSLPSASLMKSVVANPYTAKMKAILSKIKKAEEVLHANISDDFKKATEAEMATLQKRYETLKVRRLKYNSETMTDALVGFSLIAGGSALTLSGNNNGSLAWMTREQRENNKLQPFTMFGSDYKSAMPWAGPLAFGGDIAAWYAMKYAETDTGAPMLTKDQTLPMVLRTSFVTLLKEQPLTSGIKAVEEVTTGEGDVYRNAIAQIIGSYVPIPAEARKITQMLVNEEGTVADLRGGTFYERIAYAALGVEPDNKKTDRFGEHTQTPRTWLTQTVTRLAPRAEKERTEIDKIISTDVHGNIASKPTMLMSGVRMTEFRNEEGLTLDYVFNRRLKDTYIGKYTLKERITERINSDSWKAKFEKGFQPSETNPDTLVNEGLKQLNSDFQKYYKRTRERILKDKNLLNSFVNSDEENLLQIIENLTLDTERSGTPLSPLEVLGIE